jgi:hypothetical protein
LQNTLESDAQVAEAEWRGEIEHIQSGWRSSFSTLAGLLDCLQAQILAGESASAIG